MFCTFFLPGNVWAHQWFSIADLTYPFNMKAIDITPEMVKKVTAATLNLYST